MGDKNGKKAKPTPLKYRLSLPPNEHHMVENYADLDTEFDPMLFSSLERYLPHNLLDASRDTKHAFMQQVLRRYSTKEERNRVQNLKEYRDKIISSYQPLYRELYTMNPSMFFVPSFLEAFNGKEENKETSIKSIIYECASGVYTCKMLQPQFCEKLVQEVENIREWMHVTRSKVFQPNTSNNSGVVLEDFGMKGTLDRLMKDFISHICAILFPDVGGCSLDSHHGYVLEYGMGNDVEEAFHVDGSEVTLNVCLGERFTGGDLFFRGQRCEKHVNTETHPGENFSLSQFPGYAIIHRGCHRNGAQPTTSGHRVNLVMWCRSSVFRELQKHEKEFKDFCWKCQRDRRERRHQWVAARKAWIVGQGDVAS